MSQRAVPHLDANSRTFIEPFMTVVFCNKCRKQKDKQKQQKLVLSLQTNSTCKASPHPHGNHASSISASASNEIRKGSLRNFVIFLK